MSCGCKTNQQITYLQRKYGDNQPKSKTTHIRESVEYYVKSFLLFLVMIPVMPIIGLALLTRHCFSKKPINIKKTFRLNHVRN